MPPFITKTTRRTAVMSFSGSPSRAMMSARSEEHTSELQSQSNLVCRLLLEKKKKTYYLLVSYSTSSPSISPHPHLHLLAFSRRFILPLVHNPWLLLLCG